MSTVSLTFSIILCTFERPGDLLPTLESIRRTRIPADLNGELIVVDSSRSEDTRRVLREEFAPIPRLPLRVLHEPRRGKAHAVNTGIAAAQGQVLLFTDDDVRVPPDWIEPMVRPILKGEADALAGGIHLAPEVTRPWMEMVHRSWMADTEILDQQNPGVLTGANMSFGRHVLAKVPVFDTELGAGTALGGCDESLFSLQLVAAGYRIGAAFPTSVEHHFDPSRLARQCFVDRAKIEGQSAAYIAYHWQHETLVRPRRELLLLWCKLWIRHWIERSRWPAAEGLHAREMVRRVRLHFVRQFVAECGHPRKYAKRGLVKLGTS